MALRIGRRPTSGFYGLVVQKGPWEQTPADRGRIGGYRANNRETVAPYTVRPGRGCGDMSNIARRHVVDSPVLISNAGPRQMGKPGGMLPGVVAGRSSGTQTETVGLSQATQTGQVLPTRITNKPPRIVTSGFYNQGIDNDDEFFTPSSEEDFPGGFPSTTDSRPSPGFPGGFPSTTDSRPSSGSLFVSPIGTTSSDGISSFSSDIRAELAELVAEQEANPGLAPQHQMNQINQMNPGVAPRPGQLYGTTVGPPPGQSTMSQREFQTPNRRLDLDIIREQINGIRDSVSDGIFSPVTSEGLNRLEDQIDNLTLQSPNIQRLQERVDALRGNLDGNVPSTAGLDEMHLASGAPSSAGIVELLDEMDQIVNGMMIDEGRLISPIRNEPQANFERAERPAGVFPQIRIPEDSAMESPSSGSSSMSSGSSFSPGTQDGRTEGGRADPSSPATTRTRRQRHLDALYELQKR